MRNMQKFKIPFRLPSLNDVIRENRKHKNEGAKFKKRLENNICLFINTAHLKPVKKQCIIHVQFIEENRKRDVDNVFSSVKFILDSLVKVGILQSDSPKWVKHVKCKEIIYSDTSSVIVEIEEI